MLVASTNMPICQYIPIRPHLLVGLDYRPIYGAQSPGTYDDLAGAMAWSGLLSSPGRNMLIHDDPILLQGFLVRKMIEDSDGTE